MSHAALTSPQPPTPKTLVLGLGNPLLTDDGVGLHVAEKLRASLAGRPGVEVDLDYCGGLRLMERLVGCRRAIIIDAARRGAPVGSVTVLPLDASPTRHSGSAHDIDLAGALELGRRAGAELPAADDMRVVAIEAGEVEAFGETCTPDVAAGIPLAAELVRDLLDTWR